MKRRGRIWIRRIVRTVLYAILLVVVCAALVFAFVQTGPGRRVVVDAVEGLLSKKSYLQADITGVTGLLPFHVGIETFELHDEDGVWLEAQGASARLSVGDLIRGRILFPDVSAKTLHLLRAPNRGARRAAVEFEERKALADIPPILFSAIRIDRLVLEPDLSGIPIHCSLTGRGAIWDEPGVISAQADATGLLGGDGSLDVRIDLSADDTTIEASAGLSQLVWDDLLIREIDGHLALTLPDSHVEMQIDVSGRWKDILIDASADCAYAAAALTFRSFDVQTPFGEATGGGEFKLPSRRVTGDVDVSVPDLAAVSPMLGLDVRGQVSGRLEMIESDGGQALRGSIEGTNTGSPWGDIEIFGASIDIADVFALRDMTFTFHGDGLERDAIRIRSADLRGSAALWDRVDGNAVRGARGTLSANGVTLGETAIHDVQIAGQVDHVPLEDIAALSGGTATAIVNAVTHRHIRLDVLHATATTDEAALRLEADADGWIHTNVAGRLTASVAQDESGWRTEVSDLHATYGEHVAQLEKVALGGLSEEGFFVTNLAVRIDEALLEAAGQWQSNHFEVVARTQDLNTHAIPLAALTNTTGSLSAELLLSGTLENPAGTLRGELKGFRSAGGGLQHLPAANLKWDASIQEDGLSASVDCTLDDGGQLQASANLPVRVSFLPPGVSWMTNQPMDVTVTSTLDLATLSQIPVRPEHPLGSRILTTLVGTLTADLALTGSLSTPAGEFHGEIRELTSAKASLQHLSALNLKWDASLQEDRLSASVDCLSDDGGRLQASVVLPAHVSLAPPGVSWMTNQLMVATVTSAVDLAILNRLPLLSEQRIGGQFSADLRYEGTTSEGNATGFCRIQNGTYENFTVGTILREIEVELIGHNDALELRNASANDGGAGRIQASGSLDLTPADGFSLDVATTMKRVRLARLDAFTATTSGSLSLTGSVTRLHVGGNVTVDDALLDLNLLPPSPPPVLANFDRSAAAATNAVDETTAWSPKALTGQVRIAIPPAFRVRGPGLNSLWEGQLLFALNEDGPRLTGRVEPRRGTFNFIGRQFDLRDGEIDVGGAWPPVPVLNLRATHRRPEITAILHIRGRATDPRFELTSEPPYPPDEVLSQVLFGQGAGTITGLQAIELAAAVNNMHTGRADGGIFERTKDALSVDQLGVVEQGEAGAGQATLVVGKHISDRVYVEVSQGFNREGTIVTVEYEIRRNFTIETDTGNARLNPGIGVNWKKDY